MRVEILKNAGQLFQEDRIFKKLKSLKEEKGLSIEKIEYLVKNVWEVFEPNTEALSEEVIYKISLKNTPDQKSQSPFLITFGFCPECTKKTHQTSLSVFRILDQSDYNLLQCECNKIFLRE